MTAARLLLGGCGILEAEVHQIIEQRGWALDTRFVDSTLHCDLRRLGAGLTGTLRKEPPGQVVVFYGACHPMMDAMLDEAHAVRTEGQNCLEMLLGPERFQTELEAGAYFLLEDWARRWQEVMRKTFGDLRVAREIFHIDRTYILAIRTPCSGDFTADAEAAAQWVDLPLRWTDVGLEHLERVIADAMTRSSGRRE